MNVSTCIWGLKRIHDFELGVKDVHLDLDTVTKDGSWNPMVFAHLSGQIFCRYGDMSLPSLWHQKV